MVKEFLKQTAGLALAIGAGIIVADALRSGIRALQATALPGKRGPFSVQIPGGPFAGVSPGDLAFKMSGGHAFGPGRIIKSTQRIIPRTMPQVF